MGDEGWGRVVGMWELGVDHQHHFVEAVSHIPIIITAFKADLDLRT